jgi:predicted anti-sigma-YlaC factor YlaD
MTRSPLTLLARASARGLLLPLLVVAATGCSLRQLALDQTASFLKGAMPAFESEWDFDLVEAALPPNIKTVEGFLQSGPGNPDLLLMAAQAYTSYGLIILEDSLERAEEDSPAATTLTQRAREMYLRGHRYGLRLLDTRRARFSEAFAKGQEELERALRTCTREDVVGLFWSGMPLASAINVSRDDVAMIALVPKAKALVARALELDEAYYHAASHMILGALHGSMPKTLGGDPDKAKQHFGRALELTGRRFLLVQVMYAKTVAVQLQDRRLFEELLREVLKAELSIDPTQQLANVAAKRRARRLLARAGELF